jgi:hypothetical protein
MGADSQNSRLVQRLSYSMFRKAAVLVRFTEVRSHTHICQCLIKGILSRCVRKSTPIECVWGDLSQGQSDRDNLRSPMYLPCEHGDTYLNLHNTSRSAVQPTGYPVHSPGVRRPGIEDDRSPPPTAEVKNNRDCTSTPLYAFVTWWLMKYWNNVTFTS